MFSLFHWCLRKVKLLITLMDCCIEFVSAMSVECIVINDQGGKIVKS